MTEAATPVKAGGGHLAVVSDPSVPCTLQAETKRLVDMIFNADMFKSAMTEIGFDVRKCPLGQLSVAQARETITTVLNALNRSLLLSTPSLRSF